VDVIVISIRFVRKS